jgi:5-methylcytosine-specific restriction enzyme subunit McrC
MANYSNTLSNSHERGRIGKIPVRNLWLLMLYASRLMRYMSTGKSKIEENPDDIPNLVAEILARIVEKRIKRNLTYGFQITTSTLNRVRGKIEVLFTESHRLLDKGLISCSFDRLTVNTPRNRFVLAALNSISRIVNDKNLGQRCVRLANTLKKLGVCPSIPSRFEISLDRFGRNDKEDRIMVTAAQLAFNLALPTEQPGEKDLPILSREIEWIRHLFEQAIGGFYDIVLTPEGWQVSTGRYLWWPVEKKSKGIDEILPSMQTDIILEKPNKKGRTIIDTKFNSIYTTNRFGDDSLRSGYLYQIYAYLRTQENANDDLSTNASGLLLHPSIGITVNESVLIQNHFLKFATVDLSSSAIDIRNRLLNIVKTDNLFVSTFASIENANVNMHI